ncbi:NACHT domain-containing protein [Trichoderma breve]|uniref:NACHT domain-containing protein n=1 Tax=Trichoderma breve TaxID=2034170 RepID=A0A9W9JQW5_9HYPO|nr:NACHT domain-containing protein [Trichoderma breve]KAJ4864120.1 NACHT domain-containing protein [Trichoderma breve]
MPLSKRASLQAQRMMREAFMELERVITVSDRAQLKNLSLEDVQQAALQIEKQLAASQSLRNMRRLAPLFTGLGHYSQAIEVLCSGTPYLPWLWAPIKLVLKISADYIEAFEQIIKVYCRLAEPLARFNLFDRAYSNNIEVQNTLAVYYSDILKFHGEAYKFVRRNAWQRLFATSWGRFQRRFDNIFADLKAHEDLVDKTANAANLSEAKEMREKLEDWRQQEMAKLKKEEEERTSTEFQAVLSVLKVDEIHQIKVFDNLISEADRNLGSCSWILQQQKIRSWARCERDTQFVVLHGVVGSGKSVLAAQIATFLRALEGSLVAAHFCTYLYPESTDYNYIMRSLMIQIIRLDPELITLSYDWLILKKKAPSNTVVEQLLRLLVEAMGALAEKKKTLHIIIDGLDECDDNTVASVVKTLDKLVTSASSSASTLLKVLLCTQMRPERINDIRPSLSQLGITDGDVTALASQITQKADGMFLWAKLVMEYINKNLFYHRDEILKAAVSLPRELGEFYGRMLSQIMANFDERSSQRISAVLSWIAFAKRPLRLAELLSALAFDTKQEQVDGLVPAYILDRCEPLIQKQADSSYSFVHVSVRDFLQSSDTALLITEDESQRRHGLATIRCLLSGQQIFAPLYPDSERTLRVLCGLHGFHMYATEYWVDYLLASLEFDQAQFFDSDFFALSCRLAENFIAAETDCEAAYGSLSDTRLALIRQKDYRLYKMVKVVLLEQNKETIEVVSIHGAASHSTTFL